MPPRIPNFPAHASLDVWQESWLLSRSSRTAGSAPGATTHDRPPALPRVTRDGALASLADGAAPVDERLRLGRAALFECLHAGWGGCAGVLPARLASAPRAPARPAPRARGRGGPSADGADEAAPPGAARRVGRALPAASAAPPGSPCSCRACSAAGICRARGPRGGRRGKGRDAIPMRGTSRMLAPSRTEYRSEHCARVSPAAWRDPQAERLLFFGGVVPCAVIERHPKLTAGVPPRERRTHTSLTYIWRRAEATPHLQRDARSGSRGRP